VINFVNQLPKGVAIYTDSPPAIYSGTGRPSFVVFVDIEEADNSAYLMQVNQEIKQSHGVLVLFDVPGYSGPIAKTNLQRLTEGVKTVVKFGTQRAYMGEQ
jgi:hypothetical protein